MFLAFNTSFIATSPPGYFVINIAYYMVFPRPPCFAIQLTILVMAISCKGQRATLSSFTPGIYFATHFYFSSYHVFN